MPERSGPVDKAALTERVRQAGEMLKNKLQSDPDLQRLSGTLLFSYRLAYWLISEICAHEGMTHEMTQWLIQAQDMAAQNTFNFLELMEDMDKVRLPWLESKRRESLARRNTLKKRARLMTEAIRRKDIPLPFHSMTSLFGDDGFQHSDTLVVFGPREALALVLRHCSKEYRRAGGRNIFLSTAKKDSEEYEGIADTVISATGWRNAGDITASFMALIDPLLKMTNNRAAGMVVIEDLDHLVTERVVPGDRRQRLRQAYMTTIQHHVDSGYALIMGVPTDDEAEDSYPRELLDAQRVTVALQDSLIIGGEPTIIVGNDVVRVDEIRDKLKEPQ